MISKKLLSKVLGEKRVILDYELSINKTEIHYGHKDIDEDGFINIYELAHKCKEWALSNKYMIDSNLSNTFQEVNNGIVGTSLIYNIDSMESKRFQSDTESGAVFKASQWILDNKVSR